MGVVHILSGKQGKATALTFLKAISAPELRMRRYCLCHEMLFVRI